MSTEMYDLWGLEARSLMQVLACSPSEDIREVGLLSVSYFMVAP